MNKLDIKRLLLSCTTFEEFDTVMNETRCKSDSEKIEYMQRLFNVEVANSKEQDAHLDYVSIAHAIMSCH